MDNSITSQAFPDKDNYGISKRDYFAARAMQAIVSRGVVEQVPLEVYASNAYKMADAMLKAREE
jgi:hypothetical protein